MRIKDFVVQHLGAGNRLIEIPMQVFASHFLDGLDEIFAYGMGKAKAHEIDVQCAPQRFFADDFLECEKDGSCFAVRYSSVGVAIVKKPGKTVDWIGIGSGEI